MSPTVSDASFTAEIMQVPALAYMDEEQQRQSQMGDGYPEYSGNQQSLHSHRVTSLKSQEPSSSTLDASSVTSAVASEAMKKFLVDNIAKEGFESAEPAALYRFEQEIVAFVEQVFSRAKHYADISDRKTPNAADMLQACDEYDLDVTELKVESAKRSKKRRRAKDSELHLVASDHRLPSPELLPSDDESTSLFLPQSRRVLPPHLPPLPPKHTYLRTPAPPPKKQAIPSLEKKLENAALVQESLKNLLLSTEVDTDQNDGELFGGVVNWEATKQPRKKWKIRK